MHTVTTWSEWQSIRKKILPHQTIGFVPTMGHLHAGHGSLCERSVADNDITVASIFVNPTQFNHASDFQQYPRTIEEDIHFLESHQIDYLFLPDEKIMYPNGYTIQVMENDISRVLEGEYRPGHFNGVLTIVLKLLNMIQPKHLYLGEKDYQQYMLIKKMVQDLFLSIDVVGCETIRAEDGLALSSRNTRLTSEQRENAAHFPRLLRSDLSIHEIMAQLTAAGFKVDYVINQWGRRLGAVWIGEVRLIDNCPLGSRRDDAESVSFHID